MNKLQYALKRAVEADSRFQGRDGRPSYRRAAQACELSSNVLSNYVNSPHPALPTLETLLAYSRIFGWSLCDVVHWALDQDPPVAADYDAVREMQRAWRVLGVPERTQAGMMLFIEEAVPGGVPPRNAYSQ